MHSMRILGISLLILILGGVVVNKAMRRQDLGVRPGLRPEFTGKPGIRPSVTPQVQVAPAADDIVLVGLNGASFRLPLSAMRHSGTLQSEFAASGQSYYKFSEIKGETLEIIIHLLIQLDQLMQKKEHETAGMDVAYIPRIFQRRVNPILEKTSNQSLAALYNAADFFDIPYISNAVASVIADRIYKEIPEPRLSSETRIWDKKAEEHKQIQQFIMQKLKEHGFLLINLDYVMKHITFRRCGIMVEQSVADYVSTFNMPLERGIGPISKIDLSKKKITSLFGLSSLKRKNQVEELTLDGNCFYDFSLDVQGEKYPFKGYDALLRLSISDCHLRSLQSDIFEGASNMRYLFLDSNQFKELPLELFRPLPKLRYLNLQENELDLLHVGQFKGLDVLNDLLLRWNRIESLPIGLLHGLKLQRLDLYGNPLTRLEIDALTGMPELKVLYLDITGLSHDQRDQIAKLLPGVQVINY
ncbi:MAG: leucine-rich repeat domain-containing protein [Candidatus Babeliales bacterium]